MATITSLGIGTNGLDSESIVTKLVALEKTPLTALQNAATIDKAKISAFGSIQSQVSTLADTATRLSASSAWVARNASSSNSAAATITASSNASATSFTLDVDQLAKAQSVSSASFASGTAVGAGTLTISRGTWTSVSGNAATDNSGVGNADNAVPLAQAALTTALANQTAANATLATATSDLSDADAALATATANAAANTAALTLANAALATATSDYTNANNSLTAANATLATANAGLASANSALTAADAGVTTATTNSTNASNAASAATSALNSANSAASSALSDDNTAAINLAVYSANNQSGNPYGSQLKSYSDAYTAWVTAVGANDHSTPSLQAAEDAALQAKNIAYGVLGSVDSAAQSAADGITATADATDASALKLTAKNALTASNSANAAATAATNALNAATATQSLASAAVASATTDAATAQAAQTTAANAVTAAQAALATATSDQAQAAADAAPTDAALATATSDRATAAAAYATANAAVGAANAAVAAAQTNLTNAQNGISTARPSFASNGTSDISITVTASDTVATLAAKINAANAGVVATVFFDGTGDRLQLHSKDTGAANGFRIQTTDADGNSNDNNGLSRLTYDPQNAAFGMASAGLQASYGQDAKVRINGAAVTSKSNTFDGNFTGVSFTVLATTTTNYNNVGGTESRSPTTMTVSEDVTQAVKNVQDFITAYNALASNLADVTKYDSATKTPSIFQGDAAILGLQSILRGMVSSISNGSAYKRLNDVGIERQLDGTLTMNTSKLSTAANNGTELAKLFTNDNKDDQTNGFALKFSKFAKGALATGGAVVNKAGSLQKELDTNAADQQRVNDRADAFEKRIRAQYSALDAKMASLNALNAYVSQQVTTWNKST